MSIDYITRQIANVDRDINSIERIIHPIDANITRKQKEAHSLLDKIAREKDLKRMIGYQKDLTKKNEEINKLEKDKSSKSKSLADKQKKKLELLSKLNKEEQKERDKTKKEQKEMLTLQQQITREMEKQKMQSLHSFDVLKPQPIIQTTYDVFVSHASEDKDDFVRDFVKCLQQNGLKVWYDEFTLRVGDSLRRSIDNGLRNSRYGIVVLSEAFFSKEWPQRELDGLFAREVNGEKVILPIWHKISKNEVMKFSPIIADMLALNTSSFTIEEIAKEISDRVLN
ncbi:TIR protein [Leadbetterella byssophila DSM 17132]|uniref:TIR protein n=2 Tax=Leadbetterella TaxID=319458 RepID=E4RWP1_LEAB4|nr:toll/interleukin-1 receptor domain-containing protein [Leadbetterella byssophila]ADQ16210.1 TIR protein [Leadbetterella byssophila DSM 17132]